MAYERDENELGALWSRKNDDGSSYISGSISGTRVWLKPVDANAKLANPKLPDWHVMKSKPRTGYRGASTDDIE